MDDVIIGIHDINTLERTAVISKAESVIITKKFYDVGSVEITGTNIDIETGSIVFFNSFAGIITDVYQDGIYSSNKFAGTDLKGITKRRIVEEDITVTDEDAATVLYDMAIQFLKTGDRNIGYLTVNEPGESGIVVDDYTFAKGKSLDESLKLFCEQFEIGYDITFDEHEMQFNVIVKSRNERCVFDTESATLNSSEYQKSVSNYKNVVYYYSDDELHIEGVETGINRNEGFCDNADDISSYFADNAVSESLSAEANERYIYGVDYKIGDEVLIADRRFEEYKIISEVEIAYEKGTSVTCPVFGKKKESVITKILKG